MSKVEIAYEMADGDEGEATKILAQWREDNAWRMSMDTPLDRTWWADWDATWTAIAWHHGQDVFSQIASDAIIAIGKRQRDMETQLHNMSVDVEKLKKKSR